MEKNLKYIYIYIYLNQFAVLETNRTLYIKYTSIIKTKNACSSLPFFPK